MSNPSAFIDSTQLLFDLQRVNELGQRLSGCLEPEEIAHRTTNGLIEKFGCAFARIWLVEADRTALRLVASAGMYTRLNGDFARVPMGAFKVGKIAQNCMPFLSNQLTEEPWVKDRDWAIANGICGFAGLPLAIEKTPLGVLAVFNRQPMTAEFLEGLRMLCTSVTVALQNALQHQQEKQAWQMANQASASHVPLSEQLSGILDPVRLILVGTERPLTTALTYTLLQTAETLKVNSCSYCRLTYEPHQLFLEAMLAPLAKQLLKDWFADIAFAASCLGGTLDTATRQNMVQVRLAVPYPSCLLGLQVRIRCKQMMLQTALTRLAYLAGLTVYHTADADVPLLTNEIEELPTAKTVLWLATDALPPTVQAKLDLSITPQQLREAVTAVTLGETWGMDSQLREGLLLSEREQEIITLLAHGLRDRNIAQKLHISESTVKFHINNSLTKLNAKNRYQGVYQAAMRGWI